MCVAARPASESERGWRCTAAARGSGGSSQCFRLAEQLVGGQCRHGRARAAQLDGGARAAGADAAAGAGAQVPALRLHQHQVLLLQQLLPLPAPPLLQGVPSLLDARRYPPQRPRRRRLPPQQALVQVLRRRRRVFFLVEAVLVGQAARWSVIYAIAIQQHGPHRRDHPTRSRLLLAPPAVPGLDAPARAQPRASLLRRPAAAWLAAHGHGGSVPGGKRRRCHHRCIAGAVESAAATAAAVPVLDRRRNTGPSAGVDVPAAGFGC